MSRQIRGLLRPLGERDVGAPVIVSAVACPPDGQSSEAQIDPVLRSRLESLYRDHGRWLRQAIRRRFGAERAEDIAHEAFLRAVAYLQHEIAAPRALLMTIAKNAARDAARRAQVRNDHFERASKEAGLFHTCERQTLDDDLHLREVIKSLPEKLRDVLLLSKIGGLTNREIAQRYKVSVRAIDKRIEKAISLVVVRLRD
jgi:RNA polymerase sigma factor (sigma-70 family)